MKTFLPSPPPSALTTKLLATSPSEVANSNRHDLGAAPTEHHNTAPSSSLSRMRRLSHADNLDTNDVLGNTILDDVMLPGDLDLVEETMLDVSGDVSSVDMLLLW